MKILLALIFLFIMSISAFGGQPIIVDGIAYSSIYGNGHGKYGQYLYMPDEIKKAIGNIVIIKENAKCYSNIFTGHAYAYNSAESNNNLTYIIGGEIYGDVYGGSVSLMNNYGYSRAENNVVTIYGGKFSNTSIIYGGYVTNYLGKQPEFSYKGNTLNLHCNISLTSIFNFQNWNFYINKNVDTNKPIINANHIVDFGNNPNISINTNPELPIAKNINIANAPEILLPNIDFINGKHGSLFNTLWSLDTGNALKATLAEIKLSPQASAIADSFLSSVASINNGTDHIADLENVINCYKKSSAYKLSPFVSISSKDSHYGKNIDIKSTSAVVGILKGIDSKLGHITTGGFLEFANGKYETKNSFANAPPINGNGELRRIGGGALSRIDFINTGSGNAYYEGSFHFGKINNGYSNKDIMDAWGKYANYDLKANYIGFHSGIGYSWDASEKINIDIYSKYLSSRISGKDKKISTGEIVKFESIYSSRFRNGIRLKYAATKNISPYISANLEREFKATVESSAMGYNIGKSSLKGNTNIFKAGINIIASEKIPLSIDISAQVYIGKNKGIAGKLQAALKF